MQHKNCVLENVAEQIREFTVEKEEVLKQLNTLNIHKAAGPDGIHPTILKILAKNNNFVNAVTCLFQAVATSCCIPNSWKCAIVTALHKKGPPNDACNYRPISLTCILCKVFQILRNYFIIICMPMCVTTSAHTNMALSTASRVSLIFWKPYMRSTQV